MVEVVVEVGVVVGVVVVVGVGVGVVVEVEVVVVEAMRHFIGGAAVGFIVAVYGGGLPKLYWQDLLGWFLACLAVSGSFGLAAWGLMP